MGRFDGMTVLITGATGGLGSGTARAFAAEGARLVLSDLDGRRSAASPQRLSSAIALAEEFERTLRNQPALLSVFVQRI